MRFFSVMGFRVSANRSHDRSTNLGLAVDFVAFKKVTSGTFLERLISICLHLNDLIGFYFFLF